jgi:hypothetical protein
VALPEIVRPVVLAPAPIVVEARNILLPVKVFVVVVENAAPLWSQ